ncbi:MAG: hypothetical protein K2H28_00200 [Ruminococcus sp.]|nr:hypothetical protein [Ruminococcus sp.]
MKHPIIRLTTISRQIYNLIANCQSKGGLDVACGDATKSAQKYFKLLQ